MLNKNKKVFFIGGSSYSGTTMLDMMIGNCDEGFSIGEVYALYRPYRPENFAVKPECGCGDPNCNFWAQVRKAGEDHLYEELFTLFNDISFIVDSSKEPWWIKKQSERLQAQGIDVVNVLLWKNPADFAYSMLKRKRKHWKKFWKNYYRLYFSLIQKYFIISYEDLVQFPDKVLHSLCDKAGITFHIDQKKYWNKKHHTLFGNYSAKRHLYNEKNKTIEQEKFLINQTGQHKHRSIYHDTSYLKFLPAAVKREIKNDVKLQKIVYTLKTGNRPSDDILFSPAELILHKMGWAVKAFVGKTFGRYRRLF